MNKIMDTSIKWVSSLFCSWNKDEYQRGAKRTRNSRRCKPAKTENAKTSTKVECVKRQKLHFEFSSAKSGSKFDDGKLCMHTPPSRGKRGHHFNTEINYLLVIYSLRANSEQMTAVSESDRCDI